MQPSLAKNIFEGDAVVGESTVRRWFAEFKAREFSMENGSHGERPSKLNVNVLKAKVQENPNSTTRELTEELGFSKSSAHE